MCGIMGVMGRDAVGKVLSGLKELEYRGYDSCGIGYIDNGGLECIKSTGYVEKLIEKVEKKDTSKIDMAIGHTRWATHGGVTEYNSHPHMSESGKFAIVHNGIIENYMDLKGKYLSNVKFASDTDTEVIVQLVEYFYNESEYYVDAGNIAERVLVGFEKTLKLLKGSFAIAMLSVVDGRIYFARSGSPMIIGKSQDEYYISSDISGIMSSQEYMVLDNGMYGYIGDNLYIFDSIGQVIVNNFALNNNIGINSNKGDYPHYMLSEVYEIPNALSRTYESMCSANLKLPYRPKNIIVIGCGTSYHSGLMGCRYFEKYLGIKSECILASEFVSEEYIIGENTVAIVISQSGETADTLLALDKLKALGIYVVAITNVPTSTIVGKCDKSIFLDAGREVGVASTKAYVCQVLACMMISSAWRGMGYSAGATECDISHSWVEEWKDVFKTLCKLNITDLDHDIQELVGLCKSASAIHIIGKGVDYITSQEGALKVKEVSYKFTDAYPSGELKHGTLALIDESSVAIAIVTDTKYVGLVDSGCKEISARGGRVIVLASSDVAKVMSANIVLPDVAEELLPIVSIIPMQLLAYRLAVDLGYNPDRPRNLAKSVTVT